MAFAGHTAAILDGPLGVDATYTPQGGDPVALRVIRRSPDRQAGFGASRLTSATNVFLFATAAVAAPAEGDGLTVDGETFTIKGAPERDSSRLYWTAEAYPA